MGDRRESTSGPMSQARRQCPERGRGACGQLHGAQAAASFLGIHRSTLHVAIRRGILVPDDRTPGGHARFRQDTLEAFRARLAASPATSAASVYEPLLLLAELAHLLADQAPLADIVGAVIAGVPRALPGLDFCAVAGVVPKPHDRLALHVLGPYTLPECVLEYFSRMKTTFKFAATTALRTQAPQICEDTSAETLFTGTAGICRLWPIGAYAVMPIVARGEPLGLLICDSIHARPFLDRDRTFLHGVVDLLAVALAQHQACERPSEQSSERTPALPG
jgi:hypothetical protein